MGESYKKIEEIQEKLKSDIPVFMFDTESTPLTGFKNGELFVIVAASKKGKSLFTKKEQDV